MGTARVWNGAAPGHVRLWFHFAYSSTTVELPLETRRFETSIGAVLIRVASDVGGRFTDKLAYDEATGRVTVAKVPTTPHNPAEGTAAGLARALSGRAGADAGHVGHGMTAATNAVIQRKGGRMAVVLNEGFRDLLLIGRQDRPSLYAITTTRPAPLVDRADCYTVAGRIDAAGNEVTPLDEARLRAIATEIEGTAVVAVVVCLLHSYANPAHERRAKAILSEALPGRAICISVEIMNEFREWERASAAVLNAYLSPVMDRYLTRLAATLADPGSLGVPAGCPVLVMEAAGGLMTVDSARAWPIHTVLRGLRATWSRVRTSRGCRVLWTS